MARSHTTARPAGQDWVGRTLDRNKLATEVVGGAAGLAGFGVGAPEGAAELAGEAADAAKFIGGLSALDESAWGSAATGMDGAIRYAKRGLDDPGLVFQDIGSAVEQANIDLNPWATPRAPTFLGEMGRRFNVGRNDGKFVTESALVPAAGPIMRRAGNELIRAVRKPPTAADYLRKGYPQLQADYMARPTTKTQIDHFPPKRSKLPDTILGLKYSGAGQHLPRNVSDSPLVYGGPEWAVTMGDKLEWHAGVDRGVHGGNMSNVKGSPGWSVKKLRMRRFGPVERWVRRPAGPAKDLLWIVMTTPPSMLHQAIKDWRRERSDRHD